MSTKIPNVDIETLNKTKTEYSEVSAKSTDAIVSYEKGVDEAVDLLAGHSEDGALEPKEARKIRNKADWVILPLLFAVYTLQSLDKSTLGASSVLGIIEDNHLTADQFNTLGSAFYIGYLLFEYPHSWALQRYPVAKYLAANIFLWGIIMGLHCVCKSFGGLFILRLLLGASEGCITNGVMLITSMFYTRLEIGQRVSWTFQCNGFATIVSGFIAFGVAHSSSTAKPHQWQILFLVYCGLTFVIATWFLACFPDSPVKARFLDEEEKTKAVRRVQGNHSGIETKTWKRAQLIEALTDVKTWLFFLFAAVSNLQNGFGTQYSLIIKSFGFTTVATTALNIPAGAAQIIGITSSTFVLRRYPNARCYIAVAYFVPSVLSVLLLMCLPWGNKVGLLCSYYLLNFGGAPSFALVVSWVAVTTSGHTKKLATNAIFLVGYSLGQILCTQFWRAQYKPRNYVPWGMCLFSYCGDFILLFALRYVLNKENKRRDALGEVHVQEEYGYVERVDEKGHVRRQKVDRGMLDMTDRENLSFRYAL